MSVIATAHFDLADSDEIIPTGFVCCSHCGMLEDDGLQICDSCGVYLPDNCL